MVWKCLAPRRFNLGVIDCNRPIRCLRPRDVGVEVFQSQSKLIAIEPFRPASELRALQALDDEPEPIHLGTRRSKSRVIIGHLGGELAHQPMQCIDIDRQRGEIEIHARDSNTGR
jgi:hypothetical protein